MELKKSLGFFSVFCISSGTMISSGLFILPGLAFAQSGPAVIISHILAGLRKERNFHLQRLDAILEVTDRTWLADILPQDDHLALDGRVMEILSEHTCAFLFFHYYWYAGLHC
jgi:hypothetical protein